jgi:DNA adenine methylase
MGSDTTFKNSNPVAAATTVDMPIRAIAPWFGAKRTLAQRIMAQLGPHKGYWEPFCGSLAVLLAKEPSTFETVNDLHGDLINLANVLRVEDLAVDLYGRLSRLLMHEDIFHECASRWARRGYLPAGDPPDVARAFEFFVCSWMGRNGVAGTSSYNQGFSVRYTKNGGHAATRFQSCIESIPAWHQRLRNVTILNRDGIEMVRRIEDAAGVVIYADPPYLVKGASYVHDFDGIAHHHLATALNRFQRTRVVVSYYYHPKLAELYPPDRWNTLRVPVVKALVNQGQRDGKGVAVMAPEVLLVNGDVL